VNPDDHQDDQQTWTEPDRSQSSGREFDDLAAVFLSVVEGRRDDEH
jgi:hypothetical protein